MSASRRENSRTKSGREIGERHPELVNFVPPATITRREKLVTALASGFALAVQPVSAQTITTDTEGLTAGEVKIPVADGELPAYRAMPAHGGRFPVSAPRVTCRAARAVPARFRWRATPFCRCRQRA